MSRKQLANGHLQGVELRPLREEIGSRLPWRTGGGNIVSKRASFKVWGRLPMIPATMRMTFSFFTGGAGAAGTLIDKEPPRLDRRSIRMHADALVAGQKFVLSDALKARAQTACVNIYCLVDPEAAMLRATAFDKDNGTPCAALIALLRLVVEDVAKDDNSGPQLQMRSRALLVAQMVPLFQSVFDVGFFDMMFIPFARLLHLFIRMHRDGPLVAFKRHVFAVDSKGYCGNGRVLTPAELEEMRTAAAAQTSGDDDAPVHKRREIVLQLRFQRARDLYQKQKALNRVDVQIGEDSDASSDADASDDDDDDNGGEGSSKGTVALFGVGVKRSATGTRPGGAGAKGAFEMKASEAEDAPVLVSSNGRLTVGVPMDMRKLTQQQWLMLMITEVLTDNYEKHNHFGFTCAKMIELVEYAGSLADFPVAKVTAPLMEETVFAMLTNDELRVVDMTSGMFMTAEELKAAHPQGMFANAAAPLFFALPWIIDDEEQLAAGLATFLNEKVPFAEARAQDLIADKGRWEEPPGVKLAREQRQALAYAAVLPLVMVNGAGGTGKSLIMRIDCERINRIAPGANIACLAFKNDTVNQMRTALDGLNHIYFRTVDSYNFACGVYVPVDGPMDPTSKKKEKILKRVDIDYIIIDEAAMLATSHVRRLFENEDMPRIRQIKMYGDGDQLPPIMAGTPFCVLMQMLPQFTVTLKQNFRTSAPTLTSYIMGVRNRDFSNVGLFFDPPKPLLEPVSQQPAAAATLGSSYWVCDVDSTWDAKLAFGERILDIVKRLDPAKQRYGDMMFVTPYVYMADFLSVMIDLHYFGGSPAPVSDAMALTQGQSRQRNVLHRGAFVVIAETDSRNKEIARGRVGRITLIVDHGHGRTIDPKMTEGASGLFIHQSTAVSIPKGWERSIVLDERTVVRFTSDAAVTALLRPSACRTIHRAQGDQRKIVCCIFPPGRMSNGRVWYTGISRAQEMCITFASTETLDTMRTTEPEPCMSAQAQFLASEFTTIDGLKRLGELAVRADAVAETLHGMDDNIVDWVTDIDQFNGALEIAPNDSE